MFRWVMILYSLSICVNVAADINLTALDKSGMSLWEQKIFSGESSYTPEMYRDRPALKAVSNASASGLVLKKSIDLSETPYMSWSWLVEKTLFPLDERSKKGDDFVTRLYVVIDGGFMFWKTLSLNYVWSSNQEKDLVWDNPFAGSNVQMMSIRGKDAQTSKRYEERRNVYEDLIQVFGDKGSAEANQDAYGVIDVIAIMTDTDNSGKQAESYYGDIIFSAQ